ncbi:MAG: SDR family oxidoreductase [Pirellulaceae bacterium]
MIDPARPLSGRVVVVTGSSTGIGRQIALTLSQRGAAVILHGRSPSSALSETEQLLRRMGGECYSIPCDLEQVELLDDLVERCWTWRGHVDSWVNNAGADVLTGDAAHGSFLEKLEVLWQVDVVATAVLSRAVGQRMRSTKAAKKNTNNDYSIVNLGWDQAEQGMEGDSGQLFAMSKGAVMSFTRSLAQELGPHVRVNAVAPGWIKTEWSEHASERWQHRAQAESLMQRWGTPLDVAEVVAMLIDPRSSFVSGQIWKVNGGYRYSQLPAVE